MYLLEHFANKPLDQGLKATHWLCLDPIVFHEFFKHEWPATSIKMQSLPSLGMQARPSELENWT